MHPYVRQARAEGYRARAAFKLEQIDAKFRLIKIDVNAVLLG